MLLTIVIFFIGYMFVHRTVQKKDFMFTFSASEIKKIKNYFIFLNSILIFVFNNEAHFYWLAIGILLIIIYSMPKICQRFYLNKITPYLISFIDELCLQIQSGRSFRAAFQVSVENQNGWFARLMLDIFHQLKSGKWDNEYKILTLTQFKNEMHRIDKSNTKIIEYLKDFRSFLTIKNELNKKIKQSSAQVTLQIWISNLLFLLLLLFVISQFGLQKNYYLILMSLVLILFSNILLIKIKRSFRWKI